MKIKKTLFTILLVFIISCSNTNENTTKLCFQNKCITAEIKDTFASRQLGLMYRTELDEDKGMLFVFEKPNKYNFWMKNMKINIDMIWLNPEKRVIYIEENVPPCIDDPCPTYGPNAQSLYVVETAAHFSSKYDIQIGEIMKFK